MTKEEIAQKRQKAEGREVSWFDLYIELERKLTARIYHLERRVAELEKPHSHAPPLSLATIGSSR